jgi:hypothetical protein
MRVKAQLHHMIDAMGEQEAARLLLLIASHPADQAANGHALAEDDSFAGENLDSARTQFDDASAGRDVGIDELACELW